LDATEEKLAQTRYLTGDAIIEADIRLSPTLAQFDVAYHGAFKCNLRRVIDYPNLRAYACDIYLQPGVAQTVSFDIYKQGYYSPNEKRNPHGIIPFGPVVDWTASPKR
jgi:putative glutathione S-transferase